MKETTRATYARAYTRPYQKTGMGKLKLNGNLYGTGRSVHRPFNSRSPPVFFKRAPVEQIIRGNFFLTPTILQDCYIQMTTATLFGLCIRTSHAAGYRRARAGTRNRLLSLYGLMATHFFTLGNLCIGVPIEGFTEVL